MVPKCIVGQCTHYTDPLKCGIYGKIPEDILMGKPCKYYVKK